MRYFPAFVDVHLAPVLVVGGGEIAAQKIRLLKKTEAKITIVSPEINQELRNLVDADEVSWKEGEFRGEFLDHCRLVFSAIGNKTQDAKVAFAARARGIPVNVVDVPQLCTFITPAIVDRDPVLVAIGTEGTAPVLAQQIKGLIESWLPASLGGLAQMAAGLRKRLADQINNSQHRRRFWQQFFKGPIAQEFFANRKQNAQKLAHSAISSLAQTAISNGRVALVGAGPGDPDLLTFKAAQALQQADIIFYDRLVNPAILEKARRDAHFVKVGKAPGHHSISQEEICKQLVDAARKGQFVVRLKGGDPMIFGRAAEEIDALQAAGIDVDIIPGITSALAAAADAGVLLTERKRHRSITLMTGWSDDGPSTHDWHSLAQNHSAFAIYMGIGAAEHIQGELRNAKINNSTEVTIVENASLPNQIIAKGRASELAQLVKSNGITGPAIIFVGPRSTLFNRIGMSWNEAA